MKREMAACKRASEYPRVATRKLLSTGNRSLWNVIDAGTGIRLSFSCADTTIVQAKMNRIGRCRFIFIGFLLREKFRQDFRIYRIDKIYPVHSVNPAILQLFDCELLRQAGN